MQATGRLKHFRNKGPVTELHRASLLFEVRVDYHDVRSGRSGSETGVYSAPIVEDEDLDWTADMVHLLEFGSLEETIAAEMPSWPESADGQITRYVLKHFRRSAWKNSDLGLYSEPGESLEEFRNRCLEALREDRRNAVGQIRDVFLHRFLEAEQRILVRIREQFEDERTQTEFRLSQIQDAFAGIRERLSRCFMAESWDPLRSEDLAWPPIADVETQERLEALRDELISQHNQLLSSVTRRLEEIEPYELTFNHADIEIVPVGFLWE